MHVQAVLPGRKRPRGNTMARREARAFYLFISPWIIGFLVFSLGPIIAAGYFSFTDLQVLNVNNGLPHFVGLLNYRDLLRDRTFWLALKATAIFTLGGLTINTIVGILLAQLLNQRIPGLRLFRTIYYMPIVIAGVAAAYIWLFMLRTSDGIINDILSVVHIHGPDWLGSERAAPGALLLYNVWYVGQTMVIYLAAIQGVPTELYEAVSLDGAGAVRRFWHVTLPMISPVILFNMVIGLIGLLQAFVPPFIITQGGPNYSTWLYGFAIYQEAFNYQHGAYASAWAMILFLISIVLTVLLMSVASRYVHYQGEKGGVI
jgi:multiple sugar transport system permease protein